MAEGINLHRSNVLINYDLPWNPTKIMQRVGRINRVGTVFDRIYVFNFFPTSQTSAQLPLKDRIMEKLQAFHDTLGEDFKYLSEDEQISSHKLYKNLTEGFEDEEQGINPELAYLAIIRQVRDNDTKLFEKIKKLPIKSKAGKLSRLVNGDTTLTFIRKGYIKMFFLTSEEATKQLSFLNAIKFIKAEKEDNAISISERYFEHLENNKQAFDDKLSEEDEVIIQRTALGGNDAKIIKTLKSLTKCRKFTDEEDKMLIKMMTLWENGVIPQSLTKEIMRDIKGINDEIQAYAEILDRIPDRYFEDKNESRSVEIAQKQVILSCFIRNEEIN